MRWQSLNMCEKTYGWNLEMQMKAARGGLRILEIPVNHRCRTGGESKVSGTSARHVCRRCAYHRDCSCGLRWNSTSTGAGGLRAGTTNSAAKRAGRAVSKEKFHLAIPAFALYRRPMLSMLELERFRATPLIREPFEFLIVPEFVKADARSAIHNDYPDVNRPGSFPLGEVSYGSAFAKLVEEMRSDEFRKAFEEKFGIDLTNRPDMITVRGRCSEKDGKIHTDSETKIITILIYMNAGWESAGGRLRLLRSGNNLEDMILEVPADGRHAARVPPQQ